MKLSKRHGGDVVDRSGYCDQVTAVDPSVAQALPAHIFAHLQQQASGAQPQDQAAAAAAQQHEGADVQQDAEALKEGGALGADNAAASVSEDREAGDACWTQEAVDSSAEACAGDQQPPDSKSQKSTPNMAQTQDPPVAPSSSTPRVQTVQPMVSADMPHKTSTGSDQGKASQAEGLKTRLAAKAGAQSRLDSNNLTLHAAVNGECSSDLHGNVTGSRRRAVKRGIEDRCSVVTPSKGKYIGVLSSM